MKILMLALLVLSFALTGCGEGTSNFDENPSSDVVLVGDPANGATVYGTQCSACHGATAQGGSAPDITGTIAATFSSVVRSGRGGMPNYPVSSLSNQDLADIMAWVDTQ